MCRSPAATACDGGTERLSNEHKYRIELGRGEKWFPDYCESPQKNRSELRGWIRKRRSLVNAFTGSKLGGKPKPLVEEKP